jgi:hypothetical protein
MYANWQRVRGELYLLEQYMCPGGSLSVIPENSSCLPACNTKLQNKIGNGKKLSTKSHEAARTKNPRTFVSLAFVLFRVISWIILSHLTLFCNHPAPTRFGLRASGLAAHPTLTSANVERRRVLAAGLSLSRSYVRAL